MKRLGLLLPLFMLVSAAALAESFACFDFTDKPVTCHLAGQSCTAQRRDPNNRFSENWCKLKDLPAGTYTVTTDEYPGSDTVNIRSGQYYEDYCDVRSDHMKCTKYQPDQN